MKNLEVLEVTVRSCVYADLDDRNAIGMLINAYIEDEMGGGEPLAPEQRQHLTELLERHPKSIVLLACLGSIRCGMLVAFENVSTFSVRPMINIHDVVVLKAYRGRDVGRSLLDAVVRIAGERRCGRLTLEVRKDNLIARNLYESVGFQAPEPELYYWRMDLPESLTGAYEED
jgi:ribosomal protein S18 acetylase RimI-like enzyme